MAWLFLFVTINIINTALAQPLHLGLNFPLRSPDVASIAEHMNLLNDCGAQIYRQMAYADVLWRHVEPTDDAWNFSYPDSVFFGFPHHQYVANLYSLTIANSHNGNVGFQVPWRACSDNPPCGWDIRVDSAATIDYLLKCTSRYANHVQYWELGNETQNGSYPLGIPNAPFAEFVKHNYRWIKAVNPHLKVLLPGIVGTYGFPMQNSYQWLRTMFSRGVGDFIDVFSIHDYNAWWTTPLHIDSVLAIRDLYGLHNKEIWITESSVSSLNSSTITPSYSSEDEQAADVWRRAVIAWAKGIQTFFWHGGWSVGPPSEWAEFGLLHQSGRKKKAFHSFKLLAEHIAGFSTVEIVRFGLVDDDNLSATGGNGVWVVKFFVNGKVKYVMWSRDNQEVQLTPSDQSLYIVTRVVPTTISQNGEHVTFQQDSIVVGASDGYTFALSSIPVLVEEQAYSTSSVTQVDSKLINIAYNPSTAFIHATNACNQPVELQVYSALGNMVLRTNLIPMDHVALSTSTLSKGVYFYSSFAADGVVQLGKLFIE